MIYRTILFVICCAFSSVLSSQTKTEEIAYLKANACVINLNKPDFTFDKAFFDHDFFIFGFVHGSEKPQLIDYALLKTLSENGVRYYAPEMSFSLAFFFNKYLESGNEEFLDYGCLEYRDNVPQDASVQFRTKWQKIYKFNKKLPASEKITILGFNPEYKKNMILAHLAFLAPDNTTGIVEVDSLKYFKHLNYDTVAIDSPRPAYKAGKSPAYFFNPDRVAMIEKFRRAFEKDSTGILQAFGKNAPAVKHIMTQPTNVRRPTVMYQNVKKIAYPIIKNGGKIYANYGYYHVQQETINGSRSIMKLLKDDGTVSMVSLIGFLQNSNCLKNRRFKVDGKISIKGINFKSCKYVGYTTSKTYDGDHLFEKVNGIQLLSTVSDTNDVMLYKLNAKDSPYNTIMKFADFSIGGRRWRVKESSVATDYFQYVFLIKNSPANIPIEEELGIVGMR